MSERTRILIVGGGIAGIETATGLGRALGRRGRAEITLVDRSLSHVWKPMLHTFAAGTARPDRQKLDYFAQAADNGFRFVPGFLTGVDRSARIVSLRGIEAEAAAEARVISLPYDVLVLAIGSRANDFGTPGVAEHCATIDDLMEAESFRTRLRDRLLASLDGGASLDVAIVGGGATGVELAAELKRAIDLLARYGAPDMPRRMHLALIESGPRLLPAFPEGVSRAAAATLAGLGVRVLTGARVTQADADGYVLKDGSRIEAGIKVWAAGVKAPDALACIEGLERSKTGQLEIGPDLRTSRDPAIFAIGDCASLEDPANGGPVPATAQAASQQAEHLIRHLAAAVESRRLAAPLPPFRYESKGSIVSLADFNGWGTLGGYTFGGGRVTGLLARLAHAMLYRRHEFGLLGPMRGSLAWLADAIEKRVSPPVRLD